jgi:FlaA1/EpsC-like NDP-sugar epimerase
MRIFITGMAGTLGTQLAQLHVERGDSVVGCSRNEERGKAWQRRWEGSRCHLIVGDANSLKQEHLKLYDRIYHCAALKDVVLCEKNPLEAWRQNVELTAKVVNDRCVFISSDKACMAGGSSIYGCTKFTGERIALQAGAAVVRFGNLIGSSGSVLQLWKEAKELTLTDPDMTRYFVSVKVAALWAADTVLFGQIQAPTTMRSVRMGDLAAAFNCPIKVIGPRPGETKHQWLITAGETVNGKVWETGLRSDEAPRWSAEELLKEMP